MCLSLDINGNVLVWGQNKEGLLGLGYDITSVEKCLYMAKDNASQLAMNLWEEVYEPFANKEIANLMRSFVKQ